MVKTVAVEIQDVALCEATPSKGKLNTWIVTAIGGLRHGELTLRLVDEAEATEFNRRFRGGRGPTNVLAFPADADLAVGADIPPLGDLVVCAPLVAREASEQAKQAEAHWAHVVIHGTLHLLGYDHETNREAEVMEARERELLAGFGFADPYTLP